MEYSVPTRLTTRQRKILFPLTGQGATMAAENVEKLAGAQKIMRLFEPVEFTMISNAGARDKRLSAEARGVLWAIMTLPLDWSFNVSWAMREFNMGRARVYRIINELKDAGYMRHMRARDSRGRLLEACYYIAADPRSFERNEAIVEPVSDEPEPENCPRVKNQHVDEKQPDPRVENPRVENPRLDNRHAYKEKTPTKERVLQNGAQARDLENDPGKGKKSSGKAEPETADEARWKGRLELYRENGKWPLLGQWGPKLGEPGCLVPEHMQKQFLEDHNSFMTKKEKRANPKAPGKGYAKSTNGFAHVGKLNLPGTSHD